MGSTNRSSSKNGRDKDAKKDGEAALEKRLATLAAAQNNMQRLKPKKKDK